MVEIKTVKEYTQADTAGRELQSAVIDWLRMPLAVAVVFIHSFGGGTIDLPALHAEPLTPAAAYDWLRIAGSHVVTGFAVPTFFMFSGFLFFYKVDHWGVSVYGNKLRKRARTLLVPYLLWLALSVLQVEVFILGGALLHGRSLTVVWQYIVDSGGANMLWDSQLWGATH